MSLDVKGIRVLLWRIIRFFTNSFYKCVQKHPVVSGVLFVLFLLYLFLPSVLFILVLSSPVLVGIAFFIRVRLNSKRRNAARVKKEDSAKSSVDSNNDGVKKSVNPSFRSQKSVRRNVRKENIEWDAQGNIITLTNPLDEILGRNSLFKEKHPPVREGERSSALENRDVASNIANEDKDDHRRLLFDFEESKSDPIWNNGFGEQSEKVSGGGEAEVESMEDAEDEDEEEVQEDGNKAVEWTEDDQKNLMDLGISELERNKRLESLIARRRARKLFKMAVEKSLMDMDSAHPGQIAPIFVARSKPFDDKKNPDQGGLHMPGSAPSILLPRRNPFDLPYDPHEEKPNLTGDSFQQEFMASHQKDIFFCRHESFCRGPFFPFEPKHDLQDPQLDLCSSPEENIVQSPRYCTFERQLDKGGHEHHMSSSIGSATDLVQLESLDPTQMMNSEEPPHEEHNMNDDSSIEIEGEKTEDSNGLEPSLVNEHEVQTETDSIKDNKSSSSSSSSDASEMILNKKKFPQVLSDHVQRTLVQVAPPKGISLDRLPLDPSPTANDKSRLDNCSFFKVSCHTPTYSVASDLQVEVSDVGSPRLMALTDGAASFFDEDTVTYDADVDKDITPNSEEKLGDEKGSISGELHKTNEEHTFEGLTDWNKKLEDSIVLPTLLELEAKQNVNSTISLSSESRTIENSQSSPTNISHPKNEGVEPTLKEVEVSRMSNASNESSPRSLRNRIIEDFEVHSSSEVNFEKPKELPKPQEKFAVEARNIHDVEPIIHENANTVESKPTETSDGAHIFIEQEALRDLERPAEVVISSVPSEYNPINSEWSYDQGIMAYEKMMEDNRKFESPGDREKDPEKLNKSNVGDIPDAVEGEDVMKSIRDSRDEQDVLENLIPTEEQIFNCPSSSLHSGLGIEQVSIATGSLSSPRTVLLQETPFIPNPQHSLENSIDHSPSNFNSRNLEGQYDMMGNSTEDSNTMNQMNGPHFDLIEDKMDSLIKSTEGEPVTIVISHRDVEELLKPAEESNPSFSEHIEVTYGNLTHEGSTSPSESQQEEESIRKFTEDNPATNINKFVVQEKEEKEKLTIPIVETQFSTKPEGNVQYDTPVEHEAAMTPSKVEDVKNDQKLAPEVDSINNMDESIANKMTNDDNLNHVVDNQGETQMSGRVESVVQPLNNSEATNARYTGDTEYKSQSLFEEEGNASPPKPAGESNNSSVVENIEELRDSIGQESVKATPKPDENGLKAIENSEDKLKGLPEGLEPSKPTIVEAKATNTETKDGHIATE